MQANRSNFFILHCFVYSYMTSKVAVVQMEASTDKDDNLSRILKYVRQAAQDGARMCVFPEFMMFYTSHKQSAANLASEAESITGPFVASICQSAKENDIHVVGTFYETAPVKERVYDTAFMADNSGKVTSVYRKTHLYDALGFSESGKLVSGDFIASPVPSVVGMAGMLICYDLRFPEVSRALADAGSQIIIAPSAWVSGPKKLEHWVTMNRARAMENGCYILAPAHTGHIYCGHSLAINPFGDILFEMGTDEGVSYTDIDVSLVDSTREKLPLLQNRRLDIYPGLHGITR